MKGSRSLASLTSALTPATPLKTSKSLAALANVTSEPQLKASESQRSIATLRAQRRQLRSTSSLSSGGDQPAVDANGFPATVKGLDFHSCLSKGSFGQEFWKVCEKDGDRVFLCKKQQTSIIETLDYWDNVKREVSIMYKLDHPRIAKLLFNFNDTHAVCLGMEYVGHTLSAKMKKTESGALPLPLCVKYFYEICEAFQYCHGLQPLVIHRDVKPDTIFITGDDHVKLADFGWSNFMEEDRRTTFCGTLDYLAPEMTLKLAYNEKVDVWSGGVVLYEMSVGRKPFSDAQSLCGTDEICRSIQAANPEFPKGLDADVQALIRLLLQADPSNRPLISSVMTNEVFYKFNVVARPPEDPPLAIEDGSIEIEQASVGEESQEEAQEKLPQPQEEAQEKLPELPHAKDGSCVSIEESTVEVESTIESTVVSAVLFGSTSASVGESSSSGSVQICKGEDRNGVHFYRIEYRSADGQQPSFISKRFREFYALQDELQKTTTARFPKRLYLSRRAFWLCPAASKVELRRAALELWLQNVLRMAQKHTELKDSVTKFLEAEHVD